jgi:uncharacterized protein YwqG
LIGLFPVFRNKLFNSVSAVYTSGERIMTKEELVEKLQSYGLGKYYNDIEPHLRNTVRLYLNPVDEDEIEIGTSKVGGKPDLPNSFGWVTETNEEVEVEKKFLFISKKSKRLVTKPLSFIAQINLQEVAKLDNEDLLPKSGILYFFYSAEQEAWGFDIKDRNKFKVLYYNGDLSNLQRKDFPEGLGEDAKYKACSVVPKQEVSLPSGESDAYLHFNEEEMEDFYEYVLGKESTNKLLGYADAIQGEMECELVTNRLYCGDPSGYNNPRAKKLEPNAKDWRLLLQIDSNEECNMMWGDAGRPYFWIKKDDLLNKAFEKSWFSLQCS